MSNKNLVIQQIETEQMSKEVPQFGAGDTVVVQVKRAPASVCRPSRAWSSPSATGV